MRRFDWKRLLLLVAAAGCAGADIYTDKELKNKTGLPFYMAKPYLLVKRTGGTTAAVGVEVIYLPDLEHPLYATQRVGIGKAKMTVSLEGGMLKTYTADADSKAAEFTGALTAGLKNIAEAAKIQREAEAIDSETRAMQERQLAAEDLENVAAQVKAAEPEGMGFAERTSDALSAEARNLKDPAQRGNEMRVAVTLQKKLGQLTSASSKAALARIIARLRRMARVAVAQATFELYEVRMKGGKTTLVRVDDPE